MLFVSGLDEEIIVFIHVLNAGLRDDEQDATHGELARLTGRPNTPIVVALITWS